MIEIKHLKKAYENITPLKDVNTIINKGDVISVIGPSGTGKSTLLRCINQLDKPTSGQIIFDGEDITDKKCNINNVRKKMGMVFQSFNLFGHLTIIENLMVAPMDLLGKSKQDAYDNGMKLLKMVGLAEKAFNYPAQLSGGQKQRVAIARTLAMEPEVILFDEPTSALDPTMVGEVQAVIRELASEGITMMIVTHEMKFAREICNRVFYMDEGGIYEDGTPEQIFENPQKEKTKRFINRLKVLELEINSTNADFPAMCSKINEYGFRNQIPSVAINHSTLIFEEVGFQILIKEMKCKPHIWVTVGYSEINDETEIVFKYNGENLNIENSRNDVALKLIKGIAKSISYEKINEDDFTNKLTVFLK